MPMNVAKEVAALQRMTTKELRQKYEDVYGEECRANHKRWLVKRIVWRLQANAEGDLSERARRRAAELANDSDLRLNPPPAPKQPEPRTVQGTVSTSHDPRLPLPGTVLRREYKGRELQVQVLTDGRFEWEGEVYQSLSAVAKAITGSHTNGFLFFRLNGKGDRR